MLKDTYTNYAKQMRDHYDKTVSQIIPLIYIGAMANSLLRKMEIRVNSPIAIVYENRNQFDTLLRHLQVFKQVKICSTADKPKAIQHVLSDSHDEVLGVLYHAGNYSLENINKICNAVSLGSIEGKAMSFLTIVGFHQMIPAGIREDFFIINLCPKIKPAEGDYLSGIEMRKNIIEYILKNFQVIERELVNVKKLGSVLGGTDGNYELFLRACGKILQLQIENLLSDDDFARAMHDINVAIDDVVRQSEDAKDDSEIPLIFCRELNSMTNKIGRALNRNHIEGQDIHRFGTSLLYDNNYYYLPEKIFNGACEALLQMVSMGQIKNALAASGILVTNGNHKIYYTVKICVYTAYGVVLRPRFYKVKRATVDKEGHPDLTILNGRRRGEEG